MTAGSHCCGAPKCQKGEAHRGASSVEDFSTILSVLKLIFYYPPEPSNSKGQRWNTLPRSFIGEVLNNTVVPVE